MGSAREYAYCTAIAGHECIVFPLQASQASIEGESVVMGITCKPSTGVWLTCHVHCLVGTQLPKVRSASRIRSGWQMIHHSLKLTKALPSY